MATEAAAPDHTSSTHEESVCVSKDKREDSQGPEGGEKEAEHAVGESCLKHQHKVDHPSSNTESESEETVKESQEPSAEVEALEKEPLEAEQLSTVEIPAPSPHALENPEAVVTELHKNIVPLSHSQQPEVEQPNILAVSVSDPSPESNEKLVTQVGQKSEDPEEECEEKTQEAVQNAEPIVTEAKSQEKPQEAQQQATFATPSDAIEEKTREPELEVHPMECGNSNIEAVPDYKEKPELIESKADSAIKEPMPLKEEDITAAEEKLVQEAYADGVSKDPEQDEFEKEESQSEEKVAAENEDKKKQPEEPSRKAEVEEIRKVEEQNETKTEKATDEGATAVTAGEQIRETLASKLEEKEEESVDTGVAKAQTEEEPAAQPVAQKQSNNILSKVRQSLVRAKKAIIGKSPTSKTEAKGADIKVT